MYFCSGKVYFKELKIKLYLLNLNTVFSGLIQRPVACKNAHYPYNNFVFKSVSCDEFGITKEGLEKKSEYFFIGSEHP